MGEQCRYCRRRFENDDGLRRHTGNCRTRKQRIDEKVTADYLTAKYASGCSSSQLVELIRREFDIVVTIGGIISRAKRLGVVTYTCKQAANLKTVRKKRETTCRKRYDVDNVSSLADSKAKRTATVRHRYGVDNVFQSGKVQKKSRRTVRRKYGVDYYAQTAEFSTKLNRGRLSRAHRRLLRSLRSQGVFCESEVRGPFTRYNEQLKRNYAPVADILLDTHRIVIEVYGDMWHANPKRYRSSDVICRWSGECTAAEIWAADAARKKHIESCGFKVIEVWESDITNADDRELWVRKLWKRLQSGKLEKLRYRSTSST